MTAEVESALYRAWQASGTSDKVLLALFEAGIVESGMRNLNYGDRDSLGVLQQRASWGTVEERMNPTASANKFIAKAKKVEKPGQTAGQLAQAVQVSAFPAKYDAVQAKAKLLILAQQAKLGAGNLSGNRSLDGLTGVIKFSNVVSDPASYRKIGLFVLGGLMMLIGLVLLMNGDRAAVKVAGAVGAGKVIKAAKVVKG